MATSDRNILATASRGLPAITADNQLTGVRLSNRGDMKAVPVGKGAYAICDEGQYFFASNPTPGTGIAGIAAADGYDATQALLHVHNTASESTNTRIYLDFLEIRCTVVDTGGSNVRYDMHIDDTDRYSSGGSAITPVNCNMASTTSPAGTVEFGALTCAAASNARYIGGSLLSSTDLVVDDAFRFDFGGAAPGQTFQGLSSSEHATLGTLVCVNAPPVVLGPDDAFLFTVNCASQSGAATWSFNLGWWER